MTDATPIDLDALTLDDVRGGALAGRPVTVLGLARSGIALARFFADAGRDGDGLRRPRRRTSSSGAIAQLGGRAVTAAPRARTSTRRRPGPAPRSSPPRPRSTPTTRRPSRGCGPRSRRSSRRARPATRRARPGQRGRTCSSGCARRRRSASPGTKGKTTTSALAARDPRPRTRSTRRSWAATSAMPLDRAAARADAGPPRRHRAVRAAAADAVARDDRRGLHERHLRPPRPPRVGRGLPARQAPARGAGGPGRRARAQRRGPGRRRRTRGSARAPAVLYRRRPARGRRARACVDGWIVAAAVERLPLAGGGIAATGPGGGIMPVDELAIPGRHNVSNALAAVAVGLLFGVAPDAIRRAAAAFTGVEHRLSRSASSTACGSSTTRRARSPTR